MEQLRRRLGPLHREQVRAWQQMSPARRIAFQNTGSDKHLRDVRGVLVTQWGRLDVEAIRRGARAVGTLDDFEVILETARREVSEE